MFRKNRLLFFILLLFHVQLLYAYESFSIAVLPNEIQYKGKIKTDTIHSINSHNVMFNIFTGDSKDGKSACSDKTIGEKVIKYFNSLNSSTLYSLGDNEWTDCHRVSNGSYEPIERLAFLRKTFFSKNFSQGKNPLKVERQGILGDKFSENSRLIFNNVMFVMLHVVGSNNNYVSTDKLCSKKSNRTKLDCKRATEEFKERDITNVRWLKSSFAIAKMKKLSAIVIAIQADPYFSYALTGYIWKKKFLPNLNEKNGFTNFMKTLIEETYETDIQVLLIHGDSHFFVVDKAMFNKDGSITKNFTRVETFGAKEQSWVKIVFDPGQIPVFNIYPIMLDSLNN